MKKILLVATDKTNLIFWRRVLEISTDISIDARLSSSIIDVNALVFENYMFAVVINNDEDNDAMVINNLMNEFREHGISVIINNEYESKFNNLQTLLKRGIRGVVDENLSIIQICNLLEIIELGGIHIDPKTFIAH